MYLPSHLPSPHPIIPTKNPWGISTPESTKQGSDDPTALRRESLLSKNPDACLCHGLLFFGSNGRIAYPYTYPVVPTYVFSIKIKHSWIGKYTIVQWILYAHWSFLQVVLEWVERVSTYLLTGCSTGVSSLQWKLLFFEVSWRVTVGT